MTILRGNQGSRSASAQIPAVRVIQTPRFSGKPERVALTNVTYQHKAPSSLQKELQTSPYDNWT